MCDVLASEQLNQYKGDYYSDELLITYRILLVENTLYLKIGDRPKVEMQVVGKDEFAVGFPLRFLRNKNDEIISFEIDRGRVQNLIFFKS